jgi:hypothetical protein
LVCSRGRLSTVIAGDQAVTVDAHQHIAIPPRRHSLHADGDTVVLLSVAVTGPATAADRPGNREARS